MSAPAATAGARELAALLDSIRDYAIFLLDRDGRITTWSTGAQAVKGYTAAEVLGRHVSLFYTAEDRERQRPKHLLEEAARAGRVEDIGWRVRKDGTLFWADVVISAVRDSDGELIGFAKVTRDLTERRRNEQLLARQARQQAAVAELGVYAMKTRDLQPVLDRAARLLAQALGTEMTHVDELGPDGARLVPRAGVGWTGDARPAVPATPETPGGLALCTGQPTVVEDLASDTRFAGPEFLRERGAVSGVCVAIPNPGQDRPYGVMAAYTSAARSFTADEVAYCQAIAHVVATANARTRAEDQLRGVEREAAEERRRTALAEEAIRQRDVFLAVAAHELRTPLTALQLKLEGLARILRTDPAAETPRAAERFADAVRQTDRLSDLIERLLDVSRMASGRLDVSLEPLDLADLVGDVVRDFQENTSAAQADIRVSAAGDLRGTWDRHRLEQVVLNLVSNAVKYGGGQPIEVQLDGRDTDVRLRVADRGIGIATEDVERIFDPFERAAPLEHFGGLGLGLYISRRIAEAHDGTIAVTSAPGKGATFELTLPRKTRGRS